MSIYRYLVVLLVVSFVYADDGFDDLRDSKKQIINYSFEKSYQDSLKLKKDWINPLSYSYIYNKDDKYTTTRSTISISQPIFKSGGIYDAIKYANNIQRYSKVSVENQKKLLVKQLFTTVVNIKKLDISIKQQKLLIDNNSIDVKRKKDEALNGLLDISFLDNAILALNSSKNILVDMNMQKDLLVVTLENLTAKDYKDIKLPYLSLTDQKKFLEKNIYIKEDSINVQSSYWLSKMILSNYLPTVTLNANYTKYHDTDNNPAFKDDTMKNIGFSLSIPLDIKSLNNIASSKIEYLKTKASLEDKKIEEENFYKSIKIKLDAIDKKIEIAKSNLKLYDDLLLDMQELYNAGLKTKDDIKTMQNSKDIKELELKKLDLDKQLELLELYSRIDDEI